MSLAERKYSAFDRELLALYLSVKHFRATLEGRSFTIFMDHKPLCGAMSSAVEKSPRQTRHLSFVAEFCTDIRHVSGESNVVADALSRPSGIVDADDSSPSFLAAHVICALKLPLCPGLDLHALADSQSVAEFDGLGAGASSLRIKSLPLAPPSSPSAATCPPSSILCDVSQDRPRPLVPASWIEKVFHCVHGISPAGGKATVCEVARRFVWRGLRADVLRLSRQCQDCLAS